SYDGNWRVNKYLDGNSGVSNELRNAAERIAQAAVARNYARRPALLAKYGELGRARCFEDTRFHLSYLADAISFGRPSIFKDYLAWTVEVLAARGFAPDELSESLKCMREVLIETLSPESLAVVPGVFDAGLAGFACAGAGGAGAARADQS